MKIKISLVIMLLATLQGYLYSGIIITAQGGAVYASKNDVRLPGDTGDRLSYSEDLDMKTGFSPRIEAGYIYGGRHYAGFMASTLRLEGDATLDRNIMFDRRLYPAGTEVKGTYRFDSYRATYRYMFISSDKFRIGGGITGKIRDAEITLKGGGESGGLTNTGFVPLLNYYLEWIASQKLSLLTYGDAAWSPYGRAEDLFFGIDWKLNDTASLMAGYRILEGGADNDTVYTFSMFHYAVMGIQLRL